MTEFDVNLIAFLFGIVIGEVIGVILFYYLIHRKLK